MLLRPITCPSRGRASSNRISGSGCRSSAVRRRELRCRGVHLRRDVHARPGPHGGGIAARVQERGKDRLGELDPDGFIGQLFKTIGKFMPPPTGVRCPPCGVSVNASTIWSTGERHRSRQIRSTSCSATGPRSIGWRFSRPSTDPFSRRLLGYRPMLRKLFRRIWCASPQSSTGLATTPWSYRASTLK